MSTFSVSASAAFSNAIAGEFGIERELILRCARSELDSGTAERVEELLRAGPDWEYVRWTAHVHGVSALLYLSLRSTCPSLVPEDVFLQLQAGFHASGIMVHKLVREFGALSSRFEANGIGSMLIKGPVLAVDAYGDLARRKPGDLDLLISKEDFPAASEILREGGYTVDGGYQQGMQFAEIPAHIEKHKGVTFYRGACSVDLHWTLDDPPISTNMDMSRVWSRRKEVALTDLVASGPSPEDHLLFLACHGAKHNWSKVCMICDVAELIRRHPDLDWEYVLGHAKASRRERMLLLGVGLAKALLDTRLPDPVRDRVQVSPGARMLIRATSAWLFRGAGTLHIHFLRLMLLEQLSEKQEYMAHRWKRSR